RAPAPPGGAAPGGRGPTRARPAASRAAAWEGGLRVSFPAHSSRSRGPPPPNPAGARMASYGMNDVKNGMKILVNAEPAISTDTEYGKPGKGQAFTRVKYRLIRSGRVQEITMKSTDSVEAADVVD